MVNSWVENPYWQYITVESYLQTRCPIDPSSLSCWRKRIDEEEMETLQMVTIDAARRGGMLKSRSADRIIVDTTVMTNDFGVKMTVTTTLKEGVVMGMHSMPGRPWDGHT